MLREKRMDGEWFHDSKTLFFFVFLLSLPMFDQKPKKREFLSPQKFEQRAEE